MYYSAIVPVEAILDAPSRRDVRAGFEDPATLLGAANVVIAVHPVTNREFPLFERATRPGQMMHVLKVILDVQGHRMKELCDEVRRVKGHCLLDRQPD